MRLGYNTNGFAHHRLTDAVEIIAELGYRSIGLTLDVHHLDPYVTDAAQLHALGARLRDLDLVPVIETGARFLLDARRKHQPTLLSAAPDDRRRRIDFLIRAIDLAYQLGSPPIVSLWSGSPDDGADANQLDERLVSGLREVCAYAHRGGCVLGLEPEPGMYVEDMQGYERIRDLVGERALRLTLDVGHAHLTETSAEDAVRRWIGEIVNVQVEGMRKPVHDHLVPWEGDLDVPAVMRTLLSAGFRGPATLELSRHSHDAVRVARRAFELLSPTVEVPS